MACSRTVSTPSASTSAGQARNDDAEEVGNAVDDGLEDAGDTVNDCHDASTDGLEERLDLLLHAN